MDFGHDVDEFDDFDDAQVEFLKSDKLSLNGFSMPVNEVEILKRKVHQMAKQQVEGFFKDKYLHTGGKIPKSVMFHDRRINKVINYNIITGVEHAYAAIGDSLQEEDDIRLVVDILHKIGTWKHENGSAIPLEFRGGILCMYLELVEGYEF